MTTTRLYPPDFCDEETMAYLLGLAPSTFKEYVAAGVLPQPVPIGNKRRWHRASVVERVADAATRGHAPAGIMEAAAGGQTTETRRGAAGRR